MDLRCRKTKCIYNNKFSCTAKDITIDKVKLCKKFKESNEPEPDTTRTMLKRIPKYAPHRKCSDLDIACKANCLFNNNGICQANGITVNALDNKPFCITYLKK